MQGMQKYGCWEHRYLYHFDRYRYHIPSARWVLVLVPFCGFCPEMVDSSISHSVFFNKPPQIHPTSKSTMESTQNNSKSGLAPIKKPFFLKLGLFPKSKITKDEVRVLFSYLSLFKSQLLSFLITNGKKPIQNLIFFKP